MSRTASIHTLGCRLNQADTALIADDLRRAGYTLVAWGEPADLLVVNACTVTAAAAQKTRQAVRAAHRRCPHAFLAVVGCGTRVQYRNWATMDAVDLLVPNGPKTGLATYLPETPAHTPGPPRTVATDREALADPFTEPGVGLYPNHTRANLKVQEGCDFHCSYCIVPATRGRPRSRAWDDVLREAADLIERGHRELVLTGVNLALYRDGARTLPDLIQAVADLPGEFRLRLGSVEPGPTVPQLVRTMARNPRVCRFLHLSIQHGDDGILQAMNRRYSVAEFTDWAALATAEIPGLCLGTDVIAGFPGEDDGAFARSLETLARLPLGLVHVFSYSRREGTVAASLPGQVPSALTVERSRRLRRLAQDKAAGFARNAIGSVQEVLVERQNRNGAWEGWTDSYLRATLTGDPEDRPTAANTLRQVRVTAHLRGREVTAVPV